MQSVNGNTDDKLEVHNLSDEVYNLFRERILNQQYPPGFRFQLTAIEQQLGISRTPLKEALHRLEVEGLVEIRSRRGTFVASITTTDIAEAFDVRRVLEVYAASIAVQAATEAEIQKLSNITAQMSRLLGEHEYQAIVDQYIRLDHEFHDQLVSLAHNQRLINVYRQIDVHVQIARIRLRFARTDSLQTESEHEAILHALRVRAGPDAMQAVADHIELSKARILKVLEQHD